MIEILPNWHPIFVHFTVALLIVAAALHVLSHFISNTNLKNQLSTTASWNLWIGIGVTVLTVAMGWVAFNTVNHDEPSHLAMIEHRNWAMATFAVLLGIAAWEIYLYRHRKGKGWLFTALLVIAASLLMSTAWHGGELVYRHGLGVMSMPKPDGAAGHSHDGGDMEHGNSHRDQGNMNHDQSDMTKDQKDMAPNQENIDHDEMPASAPVPHSKAPPHKH